MSLDPSVFVDKMVEIATKNANKNPHATTEQKNEAIEEARADAEQMAAAIVELIKTGEVSFEQSQVTGYCPQNASLQNGAATGGKIL